MLKGVLAPKWSPVLRKEHHILWRQEFLQCPSPGEPPTVDESARNSQLATLVDSDGTVRIVGEVGVANSGLSVPPEHGSDGLVKFQGVRLLDAIRVDPEVFVVILFGLGACAPDFREPGFRTCSGLRVLLERHFLGPPCV